MDEKLLPCPFCGSEPELKEKDNGYATAWDVVCGTKGCYLEEGGDYWLKKEEAVALWNNRPHRNVTIRHCVEIARGFEWPMSSPQYGSEAEQTAEAIARAIEESI